LKNENIDKLKLIVNKKKYYFTSDKVVFRYVFIFFIVEKVLSLEADDRGISYTNIFSNLNIHGYTSL